MKYLLTFLLLSLTACTHRLHEKGFSYHPLKTKYFAMPSLVKEPIKAGEPIRFYIEGATVESAFFKNPEPKNDIGLELAKRDTNQNVVYIPLPCQYLKDEFCTPYYWKEGRYSSEVVTSVKDVVDHYLLKYKSPKAILIGYDGGGTVAALAANRLMQKGVPAELITVSGILDTRAYTTYHGTDYYYESLNPANENYLLSQVPQIHYVGGKDTDYPESFTEDFANKLPNPVSVQIRKMPTATHDNWKKYDFKIE